MFSLKSIWLSAVICMLLNLLNIQVAVAKLNELPPCLAADGCNPLDTNMRIPFSGGGAPQSPNQVVQVYCSSCGKWITKPLLGQKTAAKARTGVGPSRPDGEL